MTLKCTHCGVTFTTDNTLQCICPHCRGENYIYWCVRIPCSNVAAIWPVNEPVELTCSECKGRFPQGDVGYGFDI